MEASAVEQSLLIKAPRERVWEALIDLEQVAKWFVPALPDATLSRDENDKVSVHMGPMSVDFVLFEAIDEPKQLTVRSLPDRLIATTYILTEEDDGTQVTVRMSGFESLNPDARQERVNLSNAGWEKTLKNLDAFINGAELPFPFAAISPLFGFWRETPKTLSTERSIWIDAPRERVWQAVTDPKQIQMWMSPTTAWELTALELGGRFFVRNEDTNTEMYGEVIELLDPPHQLATRTIPEPPDTVVKGKVYTLIEEEGGTRLTVTLSGYEQEPEATRWGNMEQNTFGFGMMLQNTKAYIEGKELPFPFGF